MWMKPLRDYFWWTKLWAQKKSSVIIDWSNNKPYRPHLQYLHCLPAISLVTQIFSFRRFSKLKFRIFLLELATTWTLYPTQIQFSIFSIIYINLPSPCSNQVGKTASDLGVGFFVAIAYCPRMTPRSFHPPTISPHNPLQTMFHILCCLNPRFLSSWAP